MSVYSYWQNSCNLDTLLVILLKNISPKWTMIMIQQTFKISDFHTMVCGDKNLTEEEVMEYAGKMRQAIAIEKTNLDGKSNVLCTNIRALFASCLTDMKVGTKYSTYNPIYLYDLLCNLFPYLKIELPYLLYKNGR